MDHVASANLLTDFQKWVPRIVRLCKRMLGMGLFWSVLGVFLGANEAHIRNCDALEIASQIIAWMLIMGMMGTALGLLGSKARFVFVATVIGGIIGLSTDWSAGYTWPHAQTSRGLLLGAIVGTTLGPWLKIYIFAGKAFCAVLPVETNLLAAENESP